MLKEQKYVMVAAAIVALAAALALVQEQIQPAKAEASDNANPVAKGANTNQGYMQSCKEIQSAQSCATGPGNNGEFTSGLAHKFNGPP